ncbi:MAG: DinB family protein [Bacteroidota bacterium]
MENIDQLLKEMEQEAQTTKKMLAIVPIDKSAWKPHEKSMGLMQLAMHVAELPGWVSMGLTTEELDFATTPYDNKPVASTKALLEFFEKNLVDGVSHLKKAKPEDLLPKWTMRNGEQIYTVLTKGELIRVSISQTIHHRAQLGVYLRLLNVPIPGSYGPSADDMRF